MDEMAGMKILPGLTWFMSNRENQDIPFEETKNYNSYNILEVVYWLNVELVTIMCPNSRHLEHFLVDVCSLSRQLMQ